LEEGDWGFNQFQALSQLNKPIGDLSVSLLHENEAVDISVYLRVIKDPLGTLWHNFQK
jgi:ubiquitin carboxyl-terminal hydrolase 7